MVLQVRWYEYVREVLGGEEARKIVQDSMVILYGRLFRVIWKVCGV